MVNNHIRTIRLTVEQLNLIPVCVRPVCLVSKLPKNIRGGGLSPKKF